MTEVTLREFARLRGVSHTAVRKAIVSGRIAKTASGKIDVETASAAWDANTDQSRVSIADQVRWLEREERQADEGCALEPGPDTGAAGDPDDATLPATDDDTPNSKRIREELLGHRATRERIAAENAAIDLRVKLGELIDVAEAQRIAFTHFRMLRDSILNIAPRIRDQLAALDDADAVEELLEGELSSVLGAFDVDTVMSDITDEGENDGDAQDAADSPTS